MITAGLREIEVVDEPTGEPFPVWVLYPATVAEREVRLGRYPASLASAAPPAAGRFPLVVLSHGTGSSPFLHRVLAAHLARSGFVVALPRHPGNHRDDDSLAGTAQILADRPRQVSAVVDALETDGVLAASVSPDGVGLIGHSLGGYTALAVAGGRPTAFGRETSDGRPAPVPVTPDDRVRAVVLLAPATPWFGAPGSLSDVRVPVLLLSGAEDEHTGAWHAGLVVDGVADPATVDHRVVEGAGHFSFLSPFPPGLVGPPPSEDPPGFDRVAFSERLVRDVAAFLDRELRPQVRSG
jgi:predicted dienelactone hydrolase